MELRTRSFNDGALDGLDVMLREAQHRGTFAAGETSIGYMAGATSYSAYTAGFLHGLALGAQLRLRRMLDTLELRELTPAVKAYWEVEPRVAA